MADPNGPTDVHQADVPIGLSERARMIVSMAETLRRSGMVTPACDGNHCGPRCADPECWWDDDG